VTEHSKGSGCTKRHLTKPFESRPRRRQISPAGLLNGGRRKSSAGDFTLIVGICIRGPAHKPIDVGRSPLSGMIQRILACF
jgi:hypothetical protein